MMSGHVSPALRAVLIPYWVENIRILPVLGTEATKDRRVPAICM